MITCICFNVSDKKIAELVKNHHIHTLRDLQKEIRVCSQCGKCKPEIMHIIKDNKKEEKQHLNQEQSNLKY